MRIKRSPIFFFSLIFQDSLLFSLSFGRPWLRKCRAVFFSVLKFGHRLFALWRDDSRHRAELLPQIYPLFLFPPSTLLSSPCFPPLETQPPFSTVFQHYRILVRCRVSFSPRSEQHIFYSSEVINVFVCVFLRLIIYLRWFSLFLCFPFH